MLQTIGQNPGKSFFTVTGTMPHKVTKTRQTLCNHMGCLFTVHHLNTGNYKVEIAYTGPSPKPVPYTYYPQILDLAKAYDVMFMACPASLQTDRLINAKVLDALGKSAYLINIARGSVIDEGALLGTLQHKVIAGAALDVFNNEPNLNPAFLDLDNILHPTLEVLP